MPPKSALAFPHRVSIEDIDVLAFENVQGLFQRILHELNKPRQVVISYLNVHVANSAFAKPELKAFLQNIDFVYCDGSGIQLGAKLQGQNIPTRFPAADWIMDFIKLLSEKEKSIYLLGGQPGIADKMYSRLNKEIPNHTVIGNHHGYILKDQDLEKEVIEDINNKKPDILIVGFGTPLQEEWIQKHRHKLNTSLIMPLGAVMDYFTGETHRCPQWVGDIGFEWFYRLCLEPRRMAGRYIIGNPCFVSRIISQNILSKLQKNKAQQIAN